MFGQVPFLCSTDGKAAKEAVCLSKQLVLPQTKMCFSVFFFFSFSSYFPLPFFVSYHSHPRHGLCYWMLFSRKSLSIGAWNRTRDECGAYGFLRRLRYIIYMVSLNTWYMIFLLLLETKFFKNFILEKLAPVWFLKSCFFLSEIYLFLWIFHALYKVG